MRKDRVISDYSPWSDYELSTLAGRVLAAMEDPHMEMYFPSPDPALDELRTMVVDYITKHEIASRRGSALEVSQKNEARETVLKGLKRLAHHVNGVADGHISLLLGTGLVLVATPKRTGIPGVPQRVRLRDGRISGQMRLDFEFVPEAWEYEVEVGESAFGDREILWRPAFFTTSSRGNMLTGTEAGLEYHVRIRARNGKGTGDWSETASLLSR